ncbi:hypothetical protein ACFPIJ_29320 [Dactylosporangium cerinum]|uniref:Uncharacterized protein n=1 Tax=Dactylosporangium cerinum TaxID=1434730 RepID=A0ABV9W0M8_9ACTN
MRRRWVWAVVIAVACAGLIAVAVVWAPSGARAWLAGLAAAVLSGVAVDLILTAVRTVRARRVPEVVPVAVTVAVRRAHYLIVDDDAGRPIEVPCSGFTLRVTIEGMAERAVVLQAMRPQVLDRRPPSGELSPHAGMAPVRPFVLNLDDDPPRLVPQDGSSVDFPLTVAPHDPEVLEIEVRTMQWDVTWLLELDWVCGGRRGTVPVDLAGYPFRVIARPPRGALQW